MKVSCGLYHTACVTAAGVAITWGGNESGQVRKHGDSGAVDYLVAVDYDGKDGSRGL